MTSNKKFNYQRFISMNYSNNYVFRTESPIKATNVRNFLLCGQKIKFFRAMGERMKQQYFNNVYKGF